MGDEQHAGTEIRGDRPKAAKNLATLVYALQAASFVVGITYIAAVMVNYIKREDVAGTYVASHFRWQMRTFWYSLLWAGIGALTAIIGIGVAIFVADGLWVVYRIVKGWLRLSEGKEMYVAA